MIPRIVTAITLAGTLAGTLAAFAGEAKLSPAHGHAKAPASRKTTQPVTHTTTAPTITITGSTIADEVVLMQRMKKLHLQPVRPKSPPAQPDSTANCGGSYVSTYAAPGNSSTVNCGLSIN